MKKTHNINIGNSIVHIEEDAYEMLTAYLNEVKQHFARNADDFEIVTDIENRIAEMFAEMLSAQQKQVVNIKDVEAVISQMGSVKDFEASEEPAENVQSIPEYDPIKKLYRDKDRAIVAGVCAGLGHYLDVDIKWVRLFVFLTIFIFGSGILAYIIFWIMVPKAKTRFERMSMHGEEPNLRGFANSHLQPLVKQSGSFIAGFFDLLGKFLQGGGRIIFKIIAVGIIAFSSVVIICLIMVLAGFLGIWDSNINQVFPLNIINADYFTTSAFAAFIVCIVPALALVLFTVRVAFNSRPVSNVLSFGLLVIWLAGVATAAFYAVKISAEFKEGAEFTQNIALSPYKEYTLEADFTRFFTKDDSLNYGIDPQNYKGRRILEDHDDDFDQPRNIRLRIEKSEEGRAEISQHYKARGKTFEAALKNAQNVHYGFLQQGAVLSFSPMLWLPKGSNWRGQEVMLTLKVPVGTHIKISKSLNRYLSGADYWNCDDDSKSGFRTWTMSDDGIKCKSEAVVDPDSTHVKRP